MSVMKMRVALISNIMAPYRVPVWNELARSVESLDIILFSENEANRIWEKSNDSNEFKLHVLNCRGVYANWLDSGLYVGGGVKKILSSISPDVVISCGYTAGPFIEAILWANKRKIPLVQWYESHALSSRFNSWPMSWIRKFFLKRANAWAVAGKMTEDYLFSMGFPRQRIFRTPNTVNILEIEHSQFLPCKDSFREGPVRFLYVGQFLHRKRVDLLFDAFSSLKSEAALRLVGYGPLKDKLEERSKGFNNIEVTKPTKSLAETVAHYEWADVVVMPSDREVWGLVINEALAVGCYVLSSSVAGVTPDLVLEAKIDVGRSFDPRLGVGSLHENMSWVIDNISHIRARRKEISNWGRKFGPKLTANGLCNAIESAIEISN